MKYYICLCLINHLETDFEKCPTLGLKYNCEGTKSISQKMRVGNPHHEMNLVTPFKKIGTNKKNPGQKARQ